MLPRHLLICAVIGTCALMTVPVSAQLGRSSSSSNTNSSASAQAGKTLNEAQTALTKARQELTRIKDKTRAQLLAKPEWASVNSEKKKAQAGVDAAAKAALASIHNKPEYKKIFAEREEARKIKDSAQASAGDSGAGADQADIAKASDTFFKDGVALKQMERRALNDDQKYNDAKERLDAVNAKLTELDAKVEDALKDNPDYPQAQQAVASAEQQVESARQSLIAARQSDAQQRESAAKSRASSSSRGGGGYGR